MKNIKLIIAYDGTNYYAWQKQKDKLTISGMLENTIFKVTKEQVKIMGAGRIDRGAHALGQLATFKTDSKIPILSLTINPI